MGKRIGANKNTYDTVDAPTAITLNTSTYTTLGAADLKRIGYKVSNLSSHDILIKEQGAGDPDSLSRGFALFKRSVFESKAGTFPVGEISAKALTGSPTVLFVGE